MVSAHQQLHYTLIGLIYQVFSSGFYEKVMDNYSTEVSIVSDSELTVIDCPQYKLDLAIKIIAS